MHVFEDTFRSLRRANETAPLISYAREFRRNLFSKKTRHGRCNARYNRQMLYFGPYILNPLLNSMDEETFLNFCPSVHNYIILIRQLIFVGANRMQHNRLNDIEGTDYKGFFKEICNGKQLN